MDLVRNTIERYVKLTDADRTKVEACWRPYEFPRGTLISEAGSVEDRFYIVQSGVQRLYFQHDGTEICLRIPESG